MKRIQNFNAFRSRVANNRFLAGLTSAAVADIWRNVVKIGPDWQEQTVIPYQLPVGASTQLLVYSLDSIHRILNSGHEVNNHDLVNQIETSFLCWAKYCGDSTWKLMGDEKNAANSDPIPVNPAWQIRRAELVVSGGEAVTRADYLPIIAIGLAIDSNFERFISSVHLLQENYGTDYTFQYLDKIWFSIHQPSIANSARHSLDEIILDFDTPPSIAIGESFSFGLENGLLNHYNCWPSRIDVFLELEQLAEKLIKRY